MLGSTDYPACWIIEPARFDLWANVLADNDDAPGTRAKMLAFEPMPSLSLLSLY